MKRLTKKLLCILLITIIALSTSICYADEFSTNVINSQWTYFRDPNVYVMPIQLTNDQWVGVDRGVKLLRPAASSDWSIDTRISVNNLPTYGNGGLSEVGLVVYKDSKNWLLWGQSCNATMVASGVLNNAASPGLASAPSLYQYIRITKSSTTYTFYYSTDGVSWTSAGTYNDAAGYLTGAQYGFIGKSWQSTQLTPDNTNCYFVQFDYFNDPTSVTFNSGTLYKIVNVRSGKGLCCSGAGTANNTPTLIWPYSGQADLKWYVQSLGNSLYRIKNYNANRILACLGAGSQNNTSTVIYDDYTPGALDQEWYIQQMSNGHYKIINKLSGRILVGYFDKFVDDMLQKFGSFFIICIH